MKRLSPLLVLAIVVSMSGNNALAQPAMDSGLPLDALILRVSGDPGWLEGVNPDGTAATLEGPQVLNGIPQYEIQPSAQGLYEKYEVEHVYFFINQFEEMPPRSEPTSTGIEMRLIVLPDDAHASGYLNEAYQVQVRSESTGEMVNARFAPIEPLPAFEHPSVGWTVASEYFDAETSEFSGYASSVRYLSQVGRVIVSAKVMGPMVDFNFDLAYGLAVRQAECVMQSSPCSSVSVSEASGDGWSVAGGNVGLSDDSGNYAASRYIFPIDEPIRAPIVSNSLATPSAVGKDPVLKAWQTTKVGL